MTTINITLMNTPNFFLEKKRLEQTAEGKAVRQELQRRKQVGFYISCDEEKAEFEAVMKKTTAKLAHEEAKTVEVTYAAGVKKV